MKIMIIHNYYQQWGGEDKSTEQECRLLRGQGHEVFLYSRHNNEILGYSFIEKGRLLFNPTGH